VQQIFPVCTDRQNLLQTEEVNCYTSEMSKVARFLILLSVICLLILVTQSTNDYRACLDGQCSKGRLQGESYSQSSRGLEPSKAVPAKPVSQHGLTFVEFFAGY